MSANDPSEARLASAAFASRLESVLEAVESAPLRGTDEQRLLERLAACATAAADVERAWRVSLGRAALRVDDAAAAQAALAARCHELEAALRKSTRDLETTLGDLQQARADQAGAEARAERAADASLRKLEGWKVEYSAAMREFVTGKLSEARGGAQREHSAVLAAALTRLEDEYRERAASAARTQIEGQRQQVEAARETEAARRHEKQAQEQAHQLAAELAAQRARGDAAEQRAAELEGAARLAADQAARLRSSLELERRAHSELQRLQALKQEHELSLAAARGAGSALGVADLHQNELERLQLAFRADTASRAVLEASLRKKLADAVARADTAEALLHELDKGLVAT